MEFIVGLTRDGFAPPLSYMESDQMALMQGGVVAMAQFGSWMLSAFQQSEFFVQNCDVVMLPRAPNGNRATIFNGLGWSFAAGTKHPEESWKLVEYFSSERVQRKMSEIGVSFSAFNGTQAPFANAFPEFNVQAYTNMFDYKVMRPFSKNTNAWEYMSNQQLNDAWAGTRSVADVCRDIAQRMNTALAAE
jgi:multiple sugar transport system substrate-binding protein